MCARCNQDFDIMEIWSIELCRPETPMNKEKFLFCTDCLNEMWFEDTL